MRILGITVSTAALSAATALLGLAACSSSSDEPDLNLTPRLEPPDGTGVVAIEMNGDWRVTAVEAVEEGGTVDEPQTGPFDFMPPVVGATLRIEAGQFAAAGARDLAQAASGYQRVGSWLNHVDGLYALYDRYGWAPSIPGMMDSGGAQRLQMAFGSVDDHHMIGLVEHLFSLAFPPRDRPVFGRYRVMLERVVAQGDVSGQRGNR